MNNVLRQELFIALDGKRNTSFRYNHEFIVDGDARVKTIAAASVIAKVYRDRLMIEYSKEHPEYGFERHKGYGTSAHWVALDSAGPSTLHRKSFLKKYSIRKNLENLVY